MATSMPATTAWSTVEQGVVILLFFTIGWVIGQVIAAVIVRFWWRD